MLLYIHMCLLIWTVFSGERCGPWASCLWVPLFLTLSPWTWSLTLFFFFNFNLANNFWTISARTLIVHMSISCDKTFPWFHYFLINIRAFILHMSISCDKIFLLVSRYLSLWPWPFLELAIIGMHLCFTNIRYTDWYT